MRILGSRMAPVLAAIASVLLGAPLPPAAAAVPTPTAVAAAPTPAPGGPAGVFSGSVQVTSVSVLIRATDAAGRPVADLRPDEVTVREDGVAAEDVTLEPFVLSRTSAPPAPLHSPTAVPADATPTPTAPPSSRVTVYVQNDLLDRQQMAWVVKALRREAERLVALGPVRLVVADPEPSEVAADITTTEELDQALGTLRRHAHVFNAIERTRRDFGRDIAFSSNSVRRPLALNASQEERERVRGACDRLRTWNTAEGQGSGRILLLVSGGFDYDPWAYYASFLDPEIRSGGPTTPDSRDRGRAPADDQRMELAELWQTTSQELAGSGWTVLAFTGGLPRTDPATAAETSGHERFSSFKDKGNPHPAGAAAADQGTLVSYALDPLRRAARDSGGEVATSPAQLADALTTLTSAYVLSYTMDRPPDDAAHHLQVTVSRPGVSVRAPAVTRSAGPRQSDTARARALLAGRSGAGDVPFEVAVTDVTGSRRKGYQGRLMVTGHFGQMLPLLLSSKQPMIEVVLAVDTGSDEPFVAQGKPMPLRLADRQGTWIYEAPIRWPAGAKAVAVVVSETTTDTWGGGVAPLR